MKNVLCWCVAAFIGAAGLMLLLLLLCAMVRIAFDALTCPNNVFERNIHPNWHPEGK